jgi:5-formyltetrahydrofolate cyclo-ligase
MTPSKQQARAAARARRRESARVPASVWVSMVERLLRGRTASRVACYAPYGHEPDTSGVPAALRSAGHRVWLPRVRGSQMEWVEVDDTTDLRMSDRGIPEPDGLADPRPRFDVVLVPALAVDRLGIRLGQGGGFYDRFLAAADPRPEVVAVVHDEDLIERVPTEPHDQPVDAAVTPTRIWRPGGA